MTKREFRDLGYLQEANRLFFHPLGLALSLNIETNEDGSLNEEDLDSPLEFDLTVLDSREDPEGFLFGEYGNVTQLREERRAKRDLIVAELVKRKEARHTLFGSMIQPLADDMHEDYKTAPDKTL